MHDNICRVGCFAGMVIWFFRVVQSFPQIYADICGHLRNRKTLR